MFEGVLSWVMLLSGIIAKNPMYFIASGVFAVAAQIWMIRENKK